MMRRSSRCSAPRGSWRAPGGESSEKRSACTRRGGASSTRNAEPRAPGKNREPETPKSRLRAAFCFGKVNRMIKAGIVGGRGYTGDELLRLVSAHPQGGTV